MIDVMLLLVKADGRIEGFGSHAFRELPRIGEHIGKNDAAGVGQAYKVVDVQHPATPAAAAADVYMVHVGALADHIAGLRPGSVISP